MSEMWSQLKKFTDGESLNASTLNIPIAQLGDRTSFLYSRLKELIAGGKMSSVLLTGVALVGDGGSFPERGNAVYLDNEKNAFAAAKASMSLYDDFTAAESAFTVGILQSRNGDKGDVLIYGALNLNPAGAPILVSNMLESGETFRPGRYYLSAKEAGRITANPTGPMIYVCTISGSLDSMGGINGTAVVSPQFLDIGTSHVHRTAVLVARPAGTVSTDGYLPIDETFSAAQKGPLSLRFGGTWASKDEVDYSFFIAEESAYWPAGVTLQWKENGISDESFKVVIHAPDEEVYISNGLTARLSIPASSQNVAFSGLSANQRTWETMVFPDAGKGWTKHEASAVAESDDVPNLKVAVKAKLDTTQATVNVAFPASIQTCMIGSITEGSTFTYGGSTYEFSGDGTATEGNVPVDLGTCNADSALYLAEELNKQHNGTFAVFEETSDESSSSSSLSTRVWLVAMDAAAITADGTVVSYVGYIAGSSFDVIPEGGVSTSIAMVVYDGNCRILGDDVVIEDASPYEWANSGDVSVMVYQAGSVTVTVPTGTVASAIIVDDEPKALYDYVIGMDQAISNYWPPVPAKSAALVVNGVELDNKALFPDGPTVSFGRSTIHWFDDSRGHKPWPEGFVRRDAYIEPAYDKTEVMHWVRGFQGSTGPVTSLQVRGDSPLKVFAYGSNSAANVGDLEISADFDFSMVNGRASGYLVPKRGRSGKLIAGPVVERIVGGPGVAVISKAGCPSGQGTVVIALDNGAFHSQFTDIALENAEQAKIGMFPYIRLKGYSGSTISSPSAFTATMRVPTNLPDGDYALMVYASVFGESGFSAEPYRQNACVSFSYNILPDYYGEDRYSNLKTALLKPDGDRTVLIPFGHQSDGGYKYDGFDPVQIMTDDSGVTNRDDVVAKVLGPMIPNAPEFVLSHTIPELKPGYLVGIRMARAVTREGVPYMGPIGFINLSWSLVTASDYGSVRRNQEDLYARNIDTGLFHEVVAVTDGETGEVNLGVEQQGVPRN